MSRRCEVVAAVCRAVSLFISLPLSPNLWQDTLTHVQHKRLSPVPLPFHAYMRPYLTLWSLAPHYSRCCAMAGDPCLAALALSLNMCSMRALCEPKVVLHAPATPSQPWPLVGFSRSGSSSAMFPPRARDAKANDAWRRLFRLAAAKLRQLDQTTSADSTLKELPDCLHPNLAGERA